MIVLVIYLFWVVDLQYEKKRFKHIVPIGHKGYFALQRILFQVHSLLNVVNVTYNNIQNFLKL